MKARPASCSLASPIARPAAYWRAIRCCHTFPISNALYGADMTSHCAVRMSIAGQERLWTQRTRPFGCWRRNSASYSLASRAPRLHPAARTARSSGYARRLQSVCKLALQRKSYHLLPASIRIYTDALSIGHKYPIRRHFTRRLEMCFASQQFADSLYSAANPRPLRELTCPI